MGRGVPLTVTLPWSCECESLQWRERASVVGLPMLYNCPSTRDLAGFPGVPATTTLPCVGCGDGNYPMG